jgi:putative iron-regulated protein
MQSIIICIAILRFEVMITPSIITPSNLNRKNMMNVKSFLSVAITSALLTACGGDDNDSSTTAAQTVINEYKSVVASKAATDVTAASVVANYADFAEAVYSDSLVAVKVLDVAIDALIATPTEATFTAAKEAWLAARPMYQTSEVFRFDDGLVDGWEGGLNAWPLDEGMIDYVDTASYSASASQLNVVKNADETLTLEAGTDNTDVIDADLLRNLHELGSESNVATGYHAVEFLLWGQDLNGTEAGAGARTVADYLSSDDKVRRGQYLKQATTLLITDLTFMVAKWTTAGERRVALAADTDVAVELMFTSLAKLSAGELAGERMNTALTDESTEDEHDCFSDNTHNSHFFNAVGLYGLYNGTYIKADGTAVNGASLYQLSSALEASKAAAASANTAMFAALEEVADIKERADDGEKFDQMIDAKNTEGNKVVREAIDALQKAGDEFSATATAFGIAGVNTDV